MKTTIVKCECGEFLEITNKIVVCENCLMIHHPVKTEEEVYEYFCSQCNMGYNALFPICPKCNSIPTWEPNVTKIVITDERTFLPQNRFSKKPNNGRASRKKPIQKVEKVERVEPIQQKKESLLMNILIGIFCFSTGITFFNMLEYIILRKIINRK